MGKKPIDSYSPKNIESKWKKSIISDSPQKCNNNDLQRKAKEISSSKPSKINQVFDFEDEIDHATDERPKMTWTCESLIIEQVGNEELVYGLPKLKLIDRKICDACGERKASLFLVQAQEESEHL
ncbi:hypothetical protein HAX54_007511 [Datura stramonium]|uniref:Uncharacterized protein n=1 Tax=Datura stramonium TaxID=4076 RepID=A0ABS8TD76_DATST|nr:hypothetical protein [Datura stramonium]